MKSKRIEVNRKGIEHTGAMYSSVPTNELDWVTGSAIKVGGG